MPDSRLGVRLGAVILPEHHWPEARSRWRRAEELGFDHVWTYDHLSWRSLRDTAWFGAVPTLTAASLVTDRVRLGTLVASPTFRHPVPFAKELITLDDISGGRVTLGIGAGGLRFDPTAMGLPEWSARERADRFAEFVELTDRLLREPVTTYDGRYYSADDARTYPGCVQRPRIPFAVAATGRRGLRVAARHGETWVTTGDRTVSGPVDSAIGARMVAEQMARLDEACEEVGRDPASIGRLVLTGLVLDAGLESVESFRDTAGTYADAGVTDLVVHWPRPAEPFAGDVRTFERIFST